MKLRAALAATTALVAASALTLSPAAALSPTAPSSAVFVILPGGTATAATVAMQMPGGVPIPIGTLNPTTGKFLPAGLGSLATLSSLSGLDASGANVTATGGTAARTEGIRASDRVNILDFAPAGTTVDQTGTVDASAALAAAVTYANTKTFYSSTHTPQGACVYLPAGRYLIKSAPPRFNGMGCVIGDGSAQSVITLDPSFSGDLFSWAEAWTVYGTSGARVVSIGINGAPSASAQQNALMFYDRNDNVFLQDVFVQNVPGRCLASGIVNSTTSPPQAYIRESYMRSVRCYRSGAAGVPAVEFATQGTGSEDGTNEVSVSQMDIYGSAGPSLVIRNSSASGVLRQMKFDELRIEGKENGTTAADLLQIGDAGMTGPIALLQFTNLELIDPYTGYCALNINSGQAAGAGPSRITMQGFVGGGLANGKALCLNNTSNFRGVFSQVKSTGTNVTIGSGATGVFLDGLGAETTWTYSIDPTSLAGLSTPLRRTGDPSATGAAGGNAAVSGTVSADAASVAALTVGSGGVSVTGGSVTGVNLSAKGSYTGAVGSVPLLTIAPPPSGAAASATATGMAYSQVIGNGLLSGTGYAVNDLLTVQGGTVTGSPTVLKVTAVDGNGKPTALTPAGGTVSGIYTALPPDVANVTGGTGMGGTIRVAYYVYSTAVGSGGTGYQTPPAVTATASTYGAASGTAAVSTSLPIAAATGKVLLDTTGTTLGTAGTTGGPVKSLGALIDLSGVRVALGSTYTVPANTSLVRFTQTGAVTSTITLPTALADGQPIQFVNQGTSGTSGAITATFSPAIQGFTNGGTIAANSGFRIRWDATGGAWQREQ